jgi:hypothetical protein
VGDKAGHRRQMTAIEDRNASTSPCAVVAAVSVLHPPDEESLERANVSAEARASRVITRSSGIETVC